MKHRSWLFVPADSERKLAKSETSGADVRILDLEDAIAPSAKDRARAAALEYLSAHQLGRRAGAMWIRINSGPLAQRDLDVVIRGRPDGLVVPKVGGPDDLLAIARSIDGLEQREGLAAAGIPLLAVATETPAAVLRLAEYAHTPVVRLRALAWGAEDLSAALGAAAPADAGETAAFTYRVARSLCLLAARAAGALAIDTVQTDLRDLERLAVSSRDARLAGFDGRMAIHPDQVPVINESFTPPEAEIAMARRVVAAFAAAPGAGVVQFEGRMLDLPHLRHAERIAAAGDPA